MSRYVSIWMSAVAAIPCKVTRPYIIILRIDKKNSAIWAWSWVQLICDLTQLVVGRHLGCFTNVINDQTEVKLSNAPFMSMELKSIFVGPLESPRQGAMLCWRKREPC